MPRSSLSRQERARRYLQASMSAGYTGLLPEHREAYQSQLRGHERAYSGVRRHAMAGTRRHFDKALTPGEREHQAHLRRSEGLQERDVMSIQRELDGQGERAGARREQGNGASTGPRAARAAAGAGAGAIADVAGGGNTLMYFVGIMLLLSLVYLLVAGKGAGVIGGLVNTITSGVHTFIAPVDPIRAAERALGAGPITSPPGPSGSPAPPSPPASSAGAAGAFNFPSSTLRRKDQGRDVQLKPGQAIRSPGSFRVVKVGSDPSGFGPDYPIIDELSGPYKGEELYGGHTDTLLPAGRKVYPAGTAWARTSRTGHNAPPGWLELGYAHGGVPGPWGQRTPI